MTFVFFKRTVKQMHKGLHSPRRVSTALFQYFLKNPGLWTGTRLAQDVPSHMAEVTQTISSCALFQVHHCILRTTDLTSDALLELITTPV